MPESKNRKQRRTFTTEFKSQIVLLYQNGKRKCDIISEYDIRVGKSWNYICVLMTFLIVK